ncbi:alpha/beta fold hydrolase [Portibacter marinus]|uniref:alpha/beta fold hydrolase n=1 Tax=Portibacter marinus TaxID=2898660 RepID=UPI001F425ED4|nr:alpha/beta hydrolase [Portibacter marinus]
MRYCIFIMSVILALACEKSSDEYINDDFHVQHAGADLPVHVRGNAGANVLILMLHGAGSFGLSFRDKSFVSELESRYAVAYFDQRGAGMAQQNSQKPEEIIKVMLEDIEAVYSVLKHKYGSDLKVFLAGHSWGGLQSGLVVLRDNIDLKGWINIDGVLNLTSIAADRKKLILDIAEQQLDISFFQDEWQLLLEKTEVSETYDEILGLLSSFFELVRKDELVSNVSSSAKIMNTLVHNNPLHWWTNNHFFRPVEEAIERGLSIEQRADEIQIPVLFIYGKYDGSAPLSNGLESFSSIPHHEKNFVIFERSLHHPFDSEPIKFGEEMMEFVEKYK